MLEDIEKNLKTVRTRLRTDNVFEDVRNLGVDEVIKITERINSDLRVIEIFFGDLKTEIAELKKRTKAGL